MDGAGNTQTTSVTLNGTQSAEIQIPDVSDQVRLDFSGTSLLVRFGLRGGSAPTVDVTKGLTISTSMVETVTVPLLSGARASIWVSGSGTVKVTPGAGY
jgi:hypothetical protein